MKRAAQQLVDRAEARSDAAREQMVRTAFALRERLDPRVLIAERAEHLLARAQMAASAFGDTAKTRPVATTSSLIAFVAAVALRFWLARKTNEPAETSGEKVS